jgi:proteasome lid subunit RPN8/RPN11
MSLLKLSSAVYEQIRAHGEETYPHECCGVLLGEFAGEDWVVRAAVRAGNLRTDSAHNRYQISPGELVKIERDARAQKLSIAGFYHSHPDHPAQWSDTDLNEAHWIGCSYVITAVAKGKASTTNSFRLTGGSEEEKLFVQERIQLEKTTAAGEQTTATQNI